MTGVRPAREPTSSVRQHPLEQAGAAVETLTPSPIRRNRERAQLHLNFLNNQETQQRVPDRCFRL